ncbi:semaphorin-4D-like isoform X1 [Arapaima gigas]
MLNAGQRISSTAQSGARRLLLADNNKSSSVLFHCVRPKTRIFMTHFSVVENMTDKGNFTVPKIQESNMAFGVLGVFLGLLLEVSTHGPTSVPRTSWKHEDVNLIEFSEPGIFNYSTLLLSEENDVLYVGAREAIFELSMKNVSVKKNKVIWKVPEKHITMCVQKGKSKETDCLNYIRVLQVFDDNTLYVCGTHAFQPVCDYLSLKEFKLEEKQEDGRGKCSFDPEQSFTAVMVDGELYSGTAYNFLGSEPIISRYSPSQSLLRTEYSTSWLNEPSFVYADVIRESKNSVDGEDDKIYYFFTEVSGDLGGQRTLQKKWTTFLKAKLVCSMPELNFVFNVVHDVFILKTEDWKETVIYAVFTSQWGNVGLSAVCAYNILSVEEVFSKGKYMQKATVEQSHTKWVRYNGVIPSPRPGACINNNNRMQNINNSLHLPDKTLQFIKDHPLLEDPVLPIGNGPRLITKDVNYTQIAVERVQALDDNVYDVIFTGSDKGVLHKSITYGNEVHTVEEIQLFHNSQPIKTLLLSPQGRFLYVGSDTGVVQSPTAFCEKYATCEECILARDPYCAWHLDAMACVNIFQDQDSAKRGLSLEDYLQVAVKPGSSVELPCHIGSNLGQALWKVNGSTLTDASKFYLMREAGMLVYSMAPEDQGQYECWAVERVGAKNFTRLVAGYVLSLESASRPPTSHSTIPSSSSAHRTIATTEGNGNSARASLTTSLPSSTALIRPPQPATSLTPLPSSTVKFLQNHIFPSPDAPLQEGRGLETRDPSTKYLQHDNSNALLFLFLLFFLLFLMVVGYNCYMQYLPAPCLRMRAALLGSKKKPKPEYVACEVGLSEPVVERAEPVDQWRHSGAEQKGLRDTGYETELDCGNGKIPSVEDSPPRDKPFDVVCEAQPIEYADADAPY